MVEKVNISITLVGSVTWNKYLAIKDALPGVAANLGLTGQIIANEKIG